MLRIQHRRWAVAALAFAAGVARHRQPFACHPITACFAFFGGYFAAQPGCESTQALESNSASSFGLWIVPAVIGSYQLFCDDSRGSLRHMVPVCFRATIFGAVHGLAHPGIRATRCLISSRWVWQGMASDINSWCRDCQGCQNGKIMRQVAAPVQPIAVPDKHFSHIHVNFVGPLPSSDGHSHLLMVIDRSTRWLEAIPLQSTTATAVTDALVFGWVERFGMPQDLTSDRGVHFASKVWGVLMSRLGVCHHFTNDYHPQANGMVERAHHQLKDAPRSRLAGADWLTHLSWVLLGLRNALKEDSGISSADMVLGRPLLFPGQPCYATEPPGNAALPSHLPTRRLTYAEATSGPLVQLMAADFVYIKNGGCTPPLTPSYSGPYLVINRWPKSFLVQSGTRMESVTVDCLKPLLGTAPLVAAKPPRRSRPLSSALGPMLGAG